MNQLNLDSTMPDVQGAPDTRSIAIQRAGVKSVRYPVIVQTCYGNRQATVGTWNLDVDLPAQQRGTHMSRFIELLEENVEEPLRPSMLLGMMASMLEALDASAGQIEVTFPYFVSKAAPISGQSSMLDYDVTFIAQAQPGEARLFLKTAVPVTSLCPCSKSISQYGAHNQRTRITIKAELDSDIAVEEFFRIAEEEASCELWGLLKRPDEKFVTEHAYENPKFVEDLVRDVALRLNVDARILAYVVEAESCESIHNHNAYAMVESDRRQATDVER